METQSTLEQRLSETQLSYSDAHKIYEHYFKSQPVQNLGEIALCAFSATSSITLANFAQILKTITLKNEQNAFAQELIRVLTPEQVHTLLAEYLFPLEVENTFLRENNITVTLLMLHLNRNNNQENFYSKYLKKHVDDIKKIIPKKVPSNYLSSEELRTIRTKCKTILHDYLNTLMDLNIDFLLLNILKVIAEKWPDDMMKFFVLRYINPLIVKQFKENDVVNMIITETLIAPVQKRINKTANSTPTQENTISSGWKQVWKETMDAVCEPVIEQVKESFSLLVQGKNQPLSQSPLTQSNKRSSLRFTGKDFFNGLTKNRSSSTGDLTKRENRKSGRWSSFFGRSNSQDSIRTPFMAEYSEIVLQKIDDNLEKESQKPPIDNLQAQLEKQPQFSGFDEDLNNENYKALAAKLALQLKQAKDATDDKLQKAYPRLIRDSILKFDAHLDKIKSHKQPMDAVFVHREMMTTFDNLKNSLNLDYNEYFLTLLCHIDPVQAVEFVKTNEQYFNKGVEILSEIDAFESSHFTAPLLELNSHAHRPL